MSGYGRNIFVSRDAKFEFVSESSFFFFGFKSYLNARGHDELAKYLGEQRSSLPS